MFWTSLTKWKFCSFRSYHWNNTRRNHPFTGQSILILWFFNWKCIKRQWFLPRRKKLILNPFQGLKWSVWNCLACSSEAYGIDSGSFKSSAGAFPSHPGSSEPSWMWKLRVKINCYGSQLLCNWQVEPRDTGYLLESPVLFFAVCNQAEVHPILFSGQVPWQVAGSPILCPLETTRKLVFGS